MFAHDFFPPEASARPPRPTRPSPAGGYTLGNCAAWGLLGLLLGFVACFALQIWLNCSEGVRRSAINQGVIDEFRRLATQYPDLPLTAFVKPDGAVTTNPQPTQEAKK